MGDGVFESDQDPKPQFVATTTMAPPEAAPAELDDDVEIDLVTNEVRAGDLTVDFAGEAVDTEAAVAPVHPHAKRYLVAGIAALVAVFAITAGVLATKSRTKPAERIATEPSTTALVSTTATPVTTAPAPEPAPATEAPAPATTVRQRPATNTTVAEVPTTLPPVIIDPPPGGFPDRVER
ncbi:MAG: hypothetical protein ACOYNI_06925 [Acidimicrobiia bacterium]